MKMNLHTAPFRILAISASFSSFAAPSRNPLRPRHTCGDHCFADIFGRGRAHEPWPDELAVATAADAPV
jgi:hypothetical protein